MLEVLINYNLHAKDANPAVVLLNCFVDVVIVNAVVDRVNFHVYQNVINKLFFQPFTSQHLLKPKRNIHIPYETIFHILTIIRYSFICKKKRFKLY